MKKLALSAILGASLMLTSSAFALTAMTDSNMKAATGQAGVSITVDNVVIEQYVGSTTYTDATGTTGEAGSIVISDKHTVKQYLAMTSAADYQRDFGTAMGWTYSTTNTEWTKTVNGVTTTVDNLNGLVKGTWAKAAALSIDVGTCSILTAGLNDNLSHLLPVLSGAGYDTAPEITAALSAQGYKYDEIAMVIDAALGDVDADITAGAVQDITGVVIGLPTLLIATTADTYSVGVAKDGALNNGQNFITISKGASAMAILGGTVEIAAH